MKSIILMIICCVLTGCGGTKILTKSVPLNLEAPLTSKSNDSITVFLDGVIVRDGPGTWARNADWDEYLISIANNTDENITLEDVVVVDSMGTALHTNSDRKELVKASKETVKRYENSDLQVKAGLRPGQIFGSGAATGGGIFLTAGVVGASLSSWEGVAVILGGTAVAVVTISASAINALIRSSNNSKVAKEILARQTRQPIVLSSGSQDKLDLFFPLAPSPQLIKITYTRGSEHKMLSLDTSELLTGLHVVHKDE